MLDLDKAIEEVASRVQKRNVNIHNTTTSHDVITAGCDSHRRTQSYVCHEGTIRCIDRTANLCLFFNLDLDCNNIYMEITMTHIIKFR